MAAYAEEVQLDLLAPALRLLPDQWSVELPGGALTADHMQRVNRALDTQFNAYYQHLKGAHVREHREYTALCAEPGVSTSATAAKQRAVTEARRALQYCEQMHYDHETMWSQISPAWVVNNTAASAGGYTGTLPKRIASFIRKRKYFGATGDQHMLFPQNSVGVGTVKALAAVGAELGPLVNHGVRYVCDTVPHMNWQQGEFGDRGSCFWGEGRNVVRYVFNRRGAEGKFLALRLYSSDDPTRGTGRALVNYVDHLGLWVITNAYGMALLTAGRILATALGCGYMQHPVMCGGRTDGPIYVNNGNGIVLHPLDVKPRLAARMHVDLCLSITDEDHKAAYGDERRRPCPECGNRPACVRCDNCGNRTCVGCDCEADEYDEEDEA